MSKIFPVGSVAVVLGSSGGIGRAIRDKLVKKKIFYDVISASRETSPKVDLKSERSIIDLAEAIKKTDRELRLVVDATGLLHNENIFPEKNLRSLTHEALLENFLVNAIGPVLCLKHLSALFPREGKSVFVSLSARVGSVGDNHLGGWYSYRASKTALNQLIKTASIELARGLPDHVSVAVHPGTVATKLSKPFSKAGLKLLTPDEAAAKLWKVIESLESSDTGKFFDNEKRPIPW